MVIPMPAMQQFSGDPPEQVQKYLYYIKGCLLLVLLGSIAKIFYALAPLSEIFWCIACIFLLKDDKHTVPMYNCLMNTPLSACAQNGGGISCLTTVMFLGGMNVLFGVFGGGLFHPVIFVCLGGQGCGAYFAYASWKYLQGDDSQAGGSAGFGAGTTWSAPGVQAGPGGGREMQEASPATNFVPFAGEGNKLGAV